MQRKQMCANGSAYRCSSNQKPEPVLNKNDKRIFCIGFLHSAPPHRTILGLHWDTSQPHITRIRMRRPAQRPATKLSADIRRLVALTQTALEAPSGLESDFWQRHLDKAIVALLDNGNQHTLDSALDYLFQHNVTAYDILIDSVEQCCQSCTTGPAQAQQDVLLLAIPVLAWTRFAIGSGVLPEATVQALKICLHTHIAADNAVIGLSPTLHAIEQLPQHHSEVYQLMHALSGTPLRKHTPKAVKAPLATIPFLADTRYLIATVTVPHGSALFRWQGIPDALLAAEQRQASALAWSTDALPLIAPALPGCNLELLLPQAYFYNCREADKRIRPATILAATHYLTHHLNALPAQLKVSIGKCSHDKNGDTDEYRIGFSLDDEERIYYGTVWPLYEAEDGDELDGLLPPGIEIAHPLETIRLLLQDCGIDDITVHPEVFDAEFCDDCGSPLFPNRDGDLVHAEMPEETLDHLEQLH